MATVSIPVAQATAVVGFNIMGGNRIQTAPHYRTINRIGLVGSTNPGDCSVDVFYGSTYIGTFFNTSGGANIIPLDSKDMMNLHSNYVCEPNEPINILVSKAAVTNAIMLTMEIDEVG